MMEHYRLESGTSIPEGTPYEVARILDQARVTGERLRLFVGDPATGEVWPEESDVLGYIGRSTGRIKVLLLLPNTRSTGGAAILARHVLGIKRVRRGVRGGEWAWRHPEMDLGEWRVETRGTLGRGAKLQQRRPGSRPATQEWRTHAEFHGLGAERKAHRLREFMIGERLSK